jgi:dTDP-4-amino-4,6-dideoxy-D-galactose acyltransferase
MSAMSTISASTRVQRLDWDTHTFGFEIGRLTGNTQASDESDWAAVLDEARLAGFRLVYGEGDPTYRFSDDFLAEFGGTRVAVAVVYGGDVPTPLAERSNVAIRELPPDAPCDADLVQLSLAAGKHSRFCVDPRFPRAGFETLYRQWIERSVRREIAGVVFVATEEGRTTGMVTADVCGETGRIGLIAVDSASRGRGVGRGLMLAATHWMADRGATRLEVGTQRENTQACAFYEAFGLREISVRASYHFWLNNI